MFENASSITGPVAALTSTTKTFATVLGVAEIDGFLHLEHWITQDSDAVRQVQTLTIDATLPGADAYYIVTGTGGEEYVFFFDQPSGDSAAQVAAKIGKILEQEPNTSVSVTGAVITLTTLAAGATATVTAGVRNAADNTILAGKITVAQTVAASGTSSKRLLSRTKITDTLDAETIRLNFETNFYLGDEPPTQRSSSIQTLNHPRSITQVTTA